MELKNETPSKSKIMKVLNCDSPFRLLPNISTPPSRFTKILNPFEQHLIDRLHLPTFSPSVFAQVSTPKTEQKFKWTIDDISSLKPADIDEATISQHVSDHDPTVESLVQEKIEKFFSEKAIVPSPLTQTSVKQMALVNFITKSDNFTQTVLTLPPVLPKHVEEILAPYFNYNENIKEKADDEDSSLYRKLFVLENDEHTSPESSPAPSTGFSPIQFSPEFNLSLMKNKLESTIEMPELRDCTLSPISRSPSSRSACRLNFSSHMSVDASLVVPDVNKSLNETKFEDNVSFKPLECLSKDSESNWDMEHKQIFINDQTPQTKMFTSQRKRLSISFKDDSLGDIDMDDDIGVKRLKNKEQIDTGYNTALCDDENSVHMFASTPTKLL